MHDERTCVVPENIYTPSTEDHWKFPGEGGSKAVISEGWGGGRSWESIFQRVTDHIQNTESNI